MNPRAQAELDAALAATVEDMRLAATELAAVLEAEREALAGADVEAIDRIGARKQSLMQQLEQYDAERVQLAAATPAGAERLRPAWRATLDALAVCRERNQQNGALAGQRLAQVRRALAVLTGEPAGDGVYGRGGELRAATRSQVLAQA
ncbi:flagella synthesis protein FlgN [Fulvimonas soli]|jgi:flagella synthesis protein FlgN|uniref:Flagella synthesis protein FlgN n=1 Tax=Fulvimonas soli TaxID=155197 RepID=A0A316HR20_9GAMM|nr:flagellar protein FlgN [Fulvimonas soli]PWK83107.1 flagella synthesis protein FlgN [Fulvimonas soli]TNY24979.1 flagellar biosynthesis protein FlgN [Fulvimonas soli]